MGLLHGARLKVDVGQLCEAAVVRESALGPRAADDVGAFLEARAALLSGNVEARELLAAVALAKTEVDASLRNDIGGGGVFGDAQRMMQREQDHEGADA